MKLPWDLRVLLCVLLSVALGACYVILITYVPQLINDTYGFMSFAPLVYISPLLYAAYFVIPYSGTINLFRVKWTAVLTAVITGVVSIVFFCLYARYPVCYVVNLVNPEITLLSFTAIPFFIFTLLWVVLNINLLNFLFLTKLEYFCLIMGIFMARYFLVGSCTGLLKLLLACIRLFLMIKQ
jgi:hypothetical protein